MKTVDMVVLHAESPQRARQVQPGAGAQRPMIKSILRSGLMPLAFILLALPASAQNPQWDKIDAELSAEKERFMEYDGQLRYDSVAPAFLAHLVQALRDPASFENPWVRLDSQVSIVRSADRMVRFFSWDPLSGGTWHDMHSFAQYRNTAGEVFVQQIDKAEGGENSAYTDSDIFEVHDIDIAGKRHYLTFAYGTHGSGHHHQVAQIFSIEGDRFVRCKTCFADSDDLVEGDLVLEYARIYKAELKYDAQTGLLSYSEIGNLDDEYFRSPTGKMVVLNLVDGQFVRQ